jgi:16S rRNA processing protein RimM
MPTTPNDELPVGRIAGIFGIHGELKCAPTSAGRTLFSPGARFRLLMPQGESREVQLASVREHKGRFLIRLTGVDSANDAQTYAGATFYAARERIELEPGEHLDRDLVGCELHDESGKPLGKVQRVEHYPSSDMLIVKGNMVPMVSAFIKRIDTAGKRIIVDLPAGLLDTENAEEA